MSAAAAAALLLLAGLAHASASPACLTFTPSALLTGVPTLIRVQLNLSALPPALRSPPPAAFRVTRVHARTGARLPLAFSLTASPLSPLAFSFPLALRSATDFDVFAFSVAAAPAARRRPLPPCPAAALTVYPPPPSMPAPPPAPPLFLRDARALVLDVAYVWPSGPPLRPATAFLGAVVASACRAAPAAPADFLEREPDAQARPGRHAVAVHVGRARAQERWSRIALVTLRAAWRRPAGEPAAVVVRIRGEPARRALQVAVVPARGDGCPRDVVAVVKVMEEDGGVAVSLVAV